MVPLYAFPQPHVPCFGLWVFSVVWCSILVLRGWSLNLASVAGVCLHVRHGNTYWETSNTGGISTLPNIHFLIPC